MSNDDPEKYQIHHHQMKIVFTLSLDNNGINYLNSHEIKFNKYLIMEEFNENFGFALMTFDQIRIIINMDI